jgi:hypothetical protein
VNGSKNNDKVATAKQRTILTLSVDGGGITPALS